jgi:2-isopropylmalate synthase
VLDTTLRDGAQSEGVSFTQVDKIALVRQLDRLGIDYIEGGYPGSNPKDIAFFKEAGKLKLNHAKLTAFAATRRAKYSATEDPGLSALVKAKTPAVAIFGKTWDLHVEKVLKTDLDTNLKMIADSVRRLKRAGREVFYDAEHFFDGYRANPDYAMKTLEAAADSGADVLVLCETNGGFIPSEVSRIVAEVAERFGGGRVGIHAHNDSGMALANTVAAVERGSRHIHGTVNGLGERCGNADLCAAIPTLELKCGLHVLGRENLKKITETSRFLYEMLNLAPRGNQPYVGHSAFAHKGGMHVAGVQKDSRTFEHTDPEAVGNTRRILISELSGAATILAKTERMKIDGKGPVARQILDEVARLEDEGYHFEGAEASFELLVRRIARPYDPFFRLLHYRIINEVVREIDETVTEATVKVRVDGSEEHRVAEGDGPVNALDAALRKALRRFYPTITEMTLHDYRVRIVNPRAGTAAKVRVIITSHDHDDNWATVGVSENIIEASWQALTDSVEYKLLKDMDAGKLKPPRGRRGARE